MNISKPYRQKQTSTIRLTSQPDDVFALMCPVREYDWLPGWQTKSVHSLSGIVEQDCMFVTPTDGPDAVWITAAHDPAARRLTMYKVVPDTAVTRLDIAVEEASPGSAATITYEHTALGPAGRQLVDRHSKSGYEKAIAAWQQLIDRYLTGKAA